MVYFLARPNPVKFLLLAVMAAHATSSAAEDLPQRVGYLSLAHCAVPVAFEGNAKELGVGMEHALLAIDGNDGSETDVGKSVTNLEYLEAKAKGIPRYVFVLKPILTSLGIWQKNRSADFSGIVDSPKLFEFVESLRDPKENWVFPFDSAQEITGTLRTQLAYLFMDALTIRAHVLGWSMGSLIAQELVLRHPSKVNKLILYAAHCGAEMFPHLASKSSSN